MSGPVLSIRGLTVTLLTGEQTDTVVDGVDFDLEEGEILALVGESGCGKSKTAEAIMDLLPAGLSHREARRLRLGETELGTLNEAAMRRVRGRDIAMVFQEPMTALDPVFTAGQQLAAVFRRHQGLSRQLARRAAGDLLKRVGLADIDRVLRSYPHELSGGMRQRVLIGMAMACRPRVLIADEVTTALDVTTQAQVLDRLVSLCRELGTAMLLITHDLGVVAQYADRALVMEQGRIVEQAGVKELFAAPQASYTAQLLGLSRRGSVQ